jgi:hypothetical protein
MPNLLTFNTPITLPALATAKINRARDVVNSDKTITIDIEIFATDGTSWGPYSLTVSNGTCTGLKGPQSGAPSIDDIVAVAPVTVEENPALANAFDRVMGAYVMAAAAGQPSENAMLDQMQQLGLLPAGTVS